MALNGMQPGRPQQGVIFFGNKSSVGLRAMVSENSGARRVKKRFFR